jgi:hypothetical protein
MAELTHEPPPTLSTRILNRLTPTPEEHRLLSHPAPDNDHLEADLKGIAA